MRNREFHSVLETIQRPEQVIYFKRTVKMNPFLRDKTNRFSALNIILRFNIQEFIAKASNLHAYKTLDSESRTILRMHLPRGLPPKHHSQKYID